MPLLLERVTVKADRLVCDLRFSPECPRMTDPQMCRRVLRARPLLMQHACVNGVGPTFAAVMERTSCAHLFEHVVIDLQAERTADDRAVFVGNTEWVDREAGIARVEVRYMDDVVALRAVKDALALVNDVLAVNESL